MWCKVAHAPPPQFGGPETFVVRVEPRNPWDGWRADVVMLGARYQPINFRAKVNFGAKKEPPKHQTLNPNNPNNPAGAAPEQLLPQSPFSNTTHRAPPPLAGFFAEPK